MLHPTGQYCKKINGKLYYFGSDKNHALEKYLSQASYLHGNKEQAQKKSDGEMTLKELCDLYLQYWNDSGEGDFALYYLRNKEKQEIDFLIVKDGKPWLPVEVKLSDVTPSKNWYKFLPLIGCKHALQVVNKSYWKIHEYEDVKILVADAAEIFQYFV